MTLPKFISRLSDAITPLLGSDGDFRSLLGSKTVRLEAPPVIEQFPEHRAGFVFAANLCARLYPRLSFVASKSIEEECAKVALAINPECDVLTGKSSSADAVLCWGMRMKGPTGVSVSPRGWWTYVDNSDAQLVRSSNPLASLATATIGVGEIFRTVFRELLKQPRSRKTPASVNFFLQEGPARLPKLGERISVGTVHLAGAGAIGEAAIHALAQLPISGKLVVVDPETIDVSNLQRYVLSFDADVGMSKCALAARALRNSKLQVVGKETAWALDGSNVVQPEQVCTALDTAAARIAVQSGLPRAIYNAWTQPSDLGWSRHEAFGLEPCLACLYMPAGSRPSLHQQVAAALREMELRVLGYLIFRVPVDVPLTENQIPKLQAYPIPEQARGWTERSILQDVLSNFRVDSKVSDSWRGRQLTDLYREGICGGAIITTDRQGVPEEFAVPLAHQSALAGIMLVAQIIIANSDELRRFRPQIPESRVDVLSALPQFIQRPRQRTVGCLCADADFISRYREKWEITPTKSLRRIHISSARRTKSLPKEKL